MTLLFRPIANAYSDGGDGFSAVGWMLWCLGVDKLKLTALKTDKPMKELREVWQMDFCHDLRREEQLDNHLHVIDRRFEEGKMEYAIQIMAIVLKLYEDSLSTFCGEIQILKARITVLEWLEQSDIYKVFPAPIA